MPKKTKWVVNGITVTQGHINQWMATIGRNIAPRSHEAYIRGWSIKGRIAAMLKAGTFDAVIRAEVEAFNLKPPRKIRAPSTLFRLRNILAANDPKYLRPAKMVARNIKYPHVQYRQ